MLVLNNVLKKYSGCIVLNVDNLIINQNECIALLGNNGAGKTTLLKSITDLISIDKGQIKILNFKVDEKEDWKKYTSLYMQSNFLIPYLTPKEYIKFIAAVREIPLKNLNIFLENYRDFHNNELFSNQKLVRNLSTGNKQKLGLMGALLPETKLCLLDEPYANLDIVSKEILSSKIKEIREKQKNTFIISSHNLDDILSIATRVIILKNGKIIFDSPISNVDNYTIKKFLRN